MSIGNRIPLVASITFHTRFQNGLSLNEHAGFDCQCDKTLVYVANKRRLHGPHIYIVYSHLHLLDKLLDYGRQYTPLHGLDL